MLLELHASSVVSVKPTKSQFSQCMQSVSDHKQSVPSQHIIGTASIVHGFSSDIFSVTEPWLSALVASWNTKCLRQRAPLLPWLTHHRQRLKNSLRYVGPQAGWKATRRCALVAKRICKCTFNLAAIVIQFQDDGILEEHFQPLSLPEYSSTWIGNTCSFVHRSTLFALRCCS